MDEKRDVSNAWNRERFRLVYETPEYLPISGAWKERAGVEFTRTELVTLFMKNLDCPETRTIVEKIIRLLI